MRWGEKPTHPNIPVFFLAPNRVILDHATRGRMAGSMIYSAKKQRRLSSVISFRRSYRAQSIPISAQSNISK
jgi:hypothetical protein